MRTIEINDRLFVIIDSDNKVSTVLKSFIPPTTSKSVIFDTILVKGTGLYRFIEVPVKQGKLVSDKKKFISVSFQEEAILNGIIKDINSDEKKNLTNYEKELLKSF